MKNSWSELNLEERSEKKGAQSDLANWDQLKAEVRSGPTPFERAFDNFVSSKTTKLT